MKVIATTSSPYAGQAAARAFGLDEVISSVFEVVDGRFTGEVARNCYGDGKAHAVSAYAEAHGYDLAEADSLRRMMTRDRSESEMDAIRVHFVERAVGRGVASEVADSTFSACRAASAS